MISKFSVKKPLTVIVAVIIVIILGIMSFTNMTPDLLPNMEFPYVMIMTTYPGASPEKVEDTITKPLEKTMATLDKIDVVSSKSSENFSMIMLQFTDDANMDSITIDIREKLDNVKSGWEDTVGNPYILKISADLMPVAVAAVDYEGKNTEEISSFVTNTLQTKLDGIEGVASVTESGIIEKKLNVVLSQDKIDNVNKKIQKALNEKFDDAEKQLESSKEKIESGLEQVESGKQQTESGKEALKEQEKAVTEQLAKAQAELDQKQAELLETKLTMLQKISSLEVQKAELLSTRDQLVTIKTKLDEITDKINNLEKTQTALSEAYDNLKRLKSEQAVYNEQINAIKNNSSLDEKEKAALISAIENSEEYIKTQREFEALDKTLNEYGLSRLELPIELGKVKLAYNSAKLAMDTLNKALEKFGISQEQLTDSINQIDSGITQLETGISKLEGGISRLESGAISVNEAKTQLLSKQAQAGFEMSAALTELVSAQATLNSTEKELNTALSQVDSGMEELKTQKESALSAADAEKTVTMETVSQILTAQNFSMPAGYVTEDGVQYLVRVGDKFEDSEEIEELMLFDMGIDGVDPIYLKDVADIFVSDNSEEIYAKINGNNGVMLSFTKQSTYATATVAENINKTFEKLENEHEGLRFTSLMNQGDYIDLIINNVLENLLFGAILAIIILLFFLKDIRPTLIIACSIPVSVVFAVVLMYFSGVTLNVISLSGLAVGVGMLVDNSVVVIENIYRLRNEGASAIKASVSGAAQVTGAIASSTLTTICVFLPIIFIKGITRQLFTDMALTIGYALIASLIVALTLVPAISQGLLKKEVKQRKSGIFNKMLRGYEKSAAFTMRHRAITLILIVLILVASVFFTVSRGFTFMPEVEAESITVSVELPEDADFEYATSAADEISKEAQSVDGVETVGAMVGGSGVASVLGINTGGGGGTKITMYIMPSESKNKSNTEIAQEIQNKCEKNKKLKDCIVTADASSSMMSINTLTGSGISVNVFGDDLDALSNAAKGVAREIEKVDGVKEVNNGIEDTTPELKITVDKAKAIGKGLTVAQVYMDISSALKSENTATTLTADGKDLDVIVVNGKAQDLSTEDIKNYKLKVTDKEGNESTVALKDIAEITDAQSLNSISRVNQRRYITVSAEIDENKNVTLVTADVQNALKDYKLPSGVTIEYDGENEAIMEAISQLMLMLLLAVALIYLIMVAQFQSFLSPFIVMFTIPLAFTGGLLGLLVTNNTISVISLIGFVMLSGIIVNNGIVLIDYINRLRADGMEKREAIITAAKTRMRPILMTALTTILGLSTMALGYGSGAALMQPIAIVCIGGLLYATIMTLYIVPIMYDLLARRKVRVVNKEELEVIEE